MPIPNPPLVKPGILFQKVNPPLGSFPPGSERYESLSPLRCSQGMQMNIRSKEVLVNDPILGTMNPSPSFDLIGELQSSCIGEVGMVEFVAADG